MSKHCFLRRHPGEGTPMILAIVLVLLMLFCTVASSAGCGSSPKVSRRLPNRRSSPPSTTTMMMCTTLCGRAMPQAGIRTARCDSLGTFLPAAEMMLHTEAKYVPVF